MWNFIVMNILIFQGLTYANHICDKSPTAYCERDSLTSEIPNDEHDFAIMCSEYVEYVNCLELYEAVCPDDYLLTFVKPGDKSIMYKLIKDICQNDSRIHKDLAEHITCIKATVKSHVDNCILASESKSDDYFAFLREELKSGGLNLETILEDFFVLPPCLEQSYASSCAIQKIEDYCSPLASGVSLEIFKRSSMLFESCNVEDFPKLRTGFVDFLKRSNDSEILEQIISSPEFFKVLTQLQDW